MILVVFVLVMNAINSRDESRFSIESASYTNNNEKKLEIRDLHNHKILVYYPETEYDILNKNIMEKINNYINEFKDSITDADVQPNQYYTLTITYESYITDDFVSYVFNIEYYTGGAHSNHEIWTVNYDIVNSRLIGIDDLIRINPDTLHLFSSISRDELIKNPNITSMSMLMDGTSPKKENFSNFIIYKDKIILFFPQYQVAPYSSGQFVVEVPGDKIIK